MNKEIAKKLIKILLWFIAVFVVLTMVGAIIVYSQRDKVKQLIISEINKELLTEIKVQSIGIEFFKTFPYASFYLNNVLAYEPKEFQNINQTKADTLFFFNKLHLSFNVLDILENNYRIKSISAKNGCFNMNIDSLGRENYIFWKSSQTNKDSKFAFSLNRIKFTNIRYTYNNKFTKQLYSIMLNSANAKGDFNEKEHKVSINTKGIIEKIILDNLVLSTNTDIKASIEYLGNTSTKDIIIRSGDLILNDLLFSVDGKLNYKGENNIDLIIKSKEIKIEELIKLLPESYASNIKDYKSNGFIDFDFRMNGELSHKSIPNINSNFSIKNGNLSNKKLNLILSNINLKGSFSNGKERKSQTSYIRLDNFSTNWNNGKISGYAKIEDFSSLKIDAKIKANIGLEKIKDLLNQKDIKELNGNLDLDLELKGDLKSFEDISKKGVEKIYMKGRAKVSKANYLDNRIPQSIRNINSEFIFNNQSIIINNLKAKLGNSNLELKAEIIDILPYIFNKKDRFSLKGNLDMDKFIFKDWEKKNKKEEIKEEKKEEFSFPDFINLDLNTRIKRIEIESFNINNFSSRIIYTFNSLSLEDISLNLFKGSIRGNTSITLRDRKVIGDFVFNSINSKDVFNGFKNFDQKTITSNNINGLISGRINFSTQLNKDFSFDSKTLNANINYKITNGELNNIEILKKLSYFVDEKEINNVKFKEINSNLLISNSCINVDEIDFQSNAFNFSFFGKHYFDNKIDYRLRLKLSELASKKKKAKLQKQREEFGEIQEDEDSKITLFIKITGSLDKPIISYDKKNNIERVKDKINSDKEKISKAIDKDLNLGIENMKKEKQEWKKQERGEYIIDWEEDKKKDTINNKENNETKFNIEWE